jgi:uncharacterized membrane protein
MARGRDRGRRAARQRKAEHHRRAARRKPTGLVLALGVIVVLMGLAFAATQLRACRQEADWRSE